MNTSLPTGTVTFLFTDIQGSTPLWERAPEKMAAALQIHNAALRQAIEANGGVVFKTVGDAFQAAFPTAPQALKAAIEGQYALLSAPWNELGELKVRMGLHTGEATPDPGGDEYAVSHTKNRIGRIHSIAHGGQILLSQETADLVVRRLPEGVSLKDLGEHRLKGMIQLEHLFQVVFPDLPADFPVLATYLEHPHNLPIRLTSFIGRESEIDAICEHLLQPGTRLLTITGVGGTGKTSLAQQVGWNLLHHFNDGIFFIDLTSIKDPGLVIAAIAQGLSIHELPGKSLQAVLEEHLSRRRLLLIVDNFEHVLPAGPDLVGLLQAGPQVKILVTSREPLHISPERLFSLPPLHLPEPNDPLTQLQHNEAVRLFLERAQASQPDFHLTAENKLDIAEICRQLDGLPLAIELIVARLRLLTPRQLLQQLTGRLRLLSGGLRDRPARHQTMRAAIGWSYDFLPEDEQQVFYRLSVFPGSLTLEAAAAVCGDGSVDVTSAMESLLDKNLVNRRDIPAGPRFWLFETLREYAADRLEASGEREQTQHKYAVYYAKLYASHLNQDYPLWDLERHNLRNAYNWAIVTQDVEIIFTFGYIFFAWEKRIAEGRHLISRALGLPNLKAYPAKHHDLLYSAAALALISGDYEASRIYIEEMGIIGREINYNIYQYHFLNSFRLAGLGHFEAAIDSLIQMEIDQTDDFQSTMNKMMRASYLLNFHQFDDARKYARQAIDGFNQIWKPNPYGVDCLTVLGFIAVEEDSPELSLTYFKQAFQLALECSVHERVGSIYMGLGGAAMRTGDFVAGITWMSLAEIIKKTTGLTSRIMIDKMQTRYLRELRSQVAPADFNAVWDASQVLSLEQAIAYGKERLLES